MRFSLTPTPIANNLQKTPLTGVFFPLNLMECNDCKHIQLQHVLPDLYKGYKYKTPDAQTDYLHEVAQFLRARVEGEVVVEIGANNGLNCGVLGEYFDHVFGVDPAGDGIVYWREGFDLELAKRISDKLKIGLGTGPDPEPKFPDGKANLIVANNCLAHIDDLDAVFEGIDFLLADDGLVSMEFNYFHSLAKDGKYDLIYHEHLDQHTLKPFARFLKKHNLVMVNYFETDRHGGSVRVLAKRSGEIDFFEAEVNWDLYAKKVKANRELVINRVPGKFVLWGAAAKAVTLLHQTFLWPQCEYCVDSPPGKQGLYLPGTRIKIVHDFEDDSLPVLLTAWNYEREFKEQYPDRDYILPY